ncbi:MAG: glycosyltransferase [Muribaculaceae bacterium]|nr:glycosyltransferase [Muribaculaceae bacterium]
MRIVIVNKSDSTGGAAVVSRRLMEALREAGADARMLVVEKLTDSPYVELAASKRKAMVPFLMERLKIFFHLRFSRRNLFKVDTASDGLPLWRHPLVKEADAILLNWVNQGMLSLKGVGRLLRLGKPVVWTMHDMWCMTGICHHADACEGYEREGHICGGCPFLSRGSGSGDVSRDISHKVAMRKKELYGMPERLRFVAVSNWLAGRARRSVLLARQEVEVIPNAFHIFGSEGRARHPKREGDRIRILFGAARLDDPIKGLPTLVALTRLLRIECPEIAGNIEVATYGGVKDPASLSGFGVRHVHMGVIKGEDSIRKVYEESDILVSASSYETLPGTLVEAQAYGCIPVAFRRGGQEDIVDHLTTGYLAEFPAGDGIDETDATEEAARSLMRGVLWAVARVMDGEGYSDMVRMMRENVERRFSAGAVARRYLEMLSSMKDHTR